MERQPRKNEEDVIQIKDETPEEISSIPLQLQPQRPNPVTRVRIGEADLTPFNGAPYDMSVLLLIFLEPQRGA